ncbi:MAG: right-handed parallel beta-helix repeat-containing protein [Cyanobacteriota bacterium]
MRKPAQALCVGLLFLANVDSPVVAQTPDTELGNLRLLPTGQAADLKVLPRIGAGFTTTGAGYQEPFFSLEGFAPLQQTLGSNLTFLEGKLLFFTDSTIGTNLVLGKRFYSSSRNRILGGYISYDARDTGNTLFHQIGAGFERLGNWDLRVNAYLPVGNTREQTAESLSNPFFQQNSLVLNRTRQFETAMAGFDVEAGGRLVRLGEGDLRGYGGVYYYGAQGSDGGFGVKGRLEARPTDNLRMGLSVQYDPIFETRVGLSLGVNFPGTRQRGVSNSSVLARLGESVARTSTITVDEQTQNETVVTTNPKTGTPWQFRHVSLGQETGDGTFENPTGTVQDALNLAQSNEIVYVQAGTNPGIAAFKIPDGVTVLSTAAVQTVETVELGSVVLPLSGSGVFPEVTGTVTLGNNTTLSGFAIANVTGNAIEATSVRDVTIQGNRITNATGQGINLIDVAGTNAIANNSITNSGLEGVFIQASGSTQQNITTTNNSISGSGKIGIFVQGAENSQQTFTASNNQVSGSTGQGIFAQVSGTAQQKLTIENSTVSSINRASEGTGGQGIFVQASENAQQQLIAQNNTVSNTEGQGIFVQASGTTTRQEFTATGNTVNNSAGQGIFAQASGTTTQQLTLNDNKVNSTLGGSDGTGGQGIFIQVAENAQQQLTANNNTVNNSEGQGIFVQASGGVQNLTAKSNTVTGSAGQGLFVQASGTAKQEFTLENDTVTGTKRSSDGTGGQGVFVQVSGDAQQKFTLNDSQVSNSEGQGVFVQAAGGTQNFSAKGNTVTSSAGQGLFVQASGTAKQEFALENNTVNSTNLNSDGAGGQGIFVQTSGTTQQKFELNNNTVNNSAGQGVFVQASGGTQNFTVKDNKVSNSASQGIFVQASGTTQQEFTIENSTISVSGSQGIFIQSAEDAQQKFSLKNNTISNSALEGVFIQSSNGAQVAADVQFNILKDNNTPGFTAIMNSTRNFCLGLKDNNSNTNFQLQRNAGTFQVIDRDNVSANNTGTVNFVPGVGDFTNVTACP